MRRKFEQRGEKVTVTCNGETAVYAMVNGRPVVESRTCPTVTAGIRFHAYEAGTLIDIVRRAAQRGSARTARLNKAW
jgi:hypothetical protein